MTRVVLVDDEPIVTEGLKVLVDWTALGTEIVADFSSSAQALRYIIEHRPDIALVDINT